MLFNIATQIYNKVFLIILVFKKYDKRGFQLPSEVKDKDCGVCDLATFCFMMGRETNLCADSIARRSSSFAVLYMMRY